MPPPVPTPDRVSGSSIGIAFAHHQIHEEASFTAHYESDPTDSETIGEETAIGFTTPSLAHETKRIHIVVTALASDESVFEIREQPTVVVDQGTTLTAWNRFRGSAVNTVLHSQTTVIAHTLTSYDVAEAAAANLAIGAGNILHHETLAVAGAAPFGAIGNVLSRSQREFIAAPNTNYAIILTCSTNNNTLHEITLDWYEHASGTRGTR